MGLCSLGFGFGGELLEVPGRLGGGPGGRGRLLWSGALVESAWPSGFGGGKQRPGGISEEKAEVAWGGGAVTSSVTGRPVFGSTG